VCEIWSPLTKPQHTRFDTIDETTRARTTTTRKVASPRTSNKAKEIDGLIK